MPFATLIDHPSLLAALTRRTDRRRLALLVTDREWPGRALELALSDEGYTTLRAQTATQAFAVCAALDPDVVFVEQRLGRVLGASARDGNGGAVLCRRLRREGALSDATALVVMTTDVPSRADLYDTLAAGAWDLCAFPTDATVLLARCERWVRAKRCADRAADASLVDVETGLYNVRGLVQRVGELIATARRDDAGAEAPIVCIALRAEAVIAEPSPERLGSHPSDPDAAHAIQAAVSRHVGDSCRAVGRASDVYARLGVRDFAIVAVGTTANGADRLVDRLRVAAGRSASAEGSSGASQPTAAADGEGYGTQLRIALRMADARTATAADVVTAVLRAASDLDAVG